MNDKLPEPDKRAIIYEDKKLYICLASFPIVKGHTVVVWKEAAADLSFLSKNDYEYLMDKVDEIRNALLKTFNIDKVYLVYMDETKQVHWHLVPRFDEKGYNIFLHKPDQLVDFDLVEKIKSNLILNIKNNEG